MYVLDTNVISELRRPEKTNPNVLAWARSVALSDIYVSVVSLLEIKLGILLLEKKNPAQGDVLRLWLDAQILPRFATRTLIIDTVTALRCASLHVRQSRSERDALIAASALVHGMTVVTRNIVDFTDFEVPLLNPWKV